MKTNKLFAMAAIVCGAVLTSCSAIEDHPATSAYTVISFEGQALNADGFWCGTPNDNGSSFTDDWGGKTTSYPNTYVEGGVTVQNTYSIYEASYGTSDYWSGFAVSSRTSTTYAQLTPDQYNNVAGSAHSGQNFLVAQNPYGEKLLIDGADGKVVHGFYFVNSAYTVNSILNGDSYSGPKFDATDWLKCTVKGTAADGTEKTVDIDLAKDGIYVNSWTWQDLTSLGKVVSLEFTFSGSRTGAYGLNTPAYICIDDVTIE